MKKRTFFSLFLLLTVSLSAMAQVDKIVGSWKTIDDKDGSEKALVVIYKTTDGKYAGKIEKLFKRPRAKCTACEGEFKNKPIEGMIIINNMIEKGGVLGGGTILDPESGKTYKCFIQYDEKTGKLKVKGALDKMGLLGRTQIWVRAK